MAINYTNLFQILGKYVKTLNVNFGMLADIQTGIDDIEGELELKTLNRLTSSVHNTLETNKRDVETWTTNLIAEISKVITDRDFVLEQLVTSSVDINSVLQELIKDMLANAESVKVNNFTADPFSASLSFISAKPTVSLLIYAITGGYDGVTPPHPGWPASRHYENTVYQDEYIQMLPEAALHIQVVSANSDGEEILRWVDLRPKTDFYKDQERSAGVGPDIPLAHTENLITKVSSEMENFTGNKPDGWIVTSATGAIPGVDYDSYNIAFRGDFSLVIRGDEGSGPHTITLSQNLPQLIPGKGYFVACKISNNIIPGDHVNSKISTQYDLVDCTITGERLNGTTWNTTVQGGADTGSYAAADWFTTYLDFVVPFSIKPETLSLSLKFDPYGTDWMLVDEIVVAPLHYFNGLGHAILRGTEVDRLEVGDVSDTVYTQSTNGDGVFQDFFMKAYKIQLPSDSTETIVDSWAVT
jgi:hypothetical protein